MAKEQYIDIINKVLSETDYVYGDLHEDGDESNEYILVVNGTKDSEKLNELFKAELKANGIDTFPDYDYDLYYLDFVTGDNWEYYDSVYICSECYKAYRMNQGYGYNEYFIGDGYILCPDCVRDTYTNEYMADLINNPNKANLIFSQSELEEEGFIRVNNPYHYANGWYGRTDSPTEIYDKIKADNDDAEIIFSIVKTYNPWETQFDVYVREA